MSFYVNKILFCFTCVFTIFLVLVIVKKYNGDEPPKKRITAFTVAFRTAVNFHVFIAVTLRK
jgi:hypothetical protein